MLRPSTVARHSRVGHCGEGQAGGGAHGLDRGENGGGAGGAVYANGACAPLGEQRGGMLRRGAIEAVAFVVDRNHDEHRKIGSSFTRGHESFARLVQRRHCLDDEQIRACFDQGMNLLREGGTCLFESGLAQGFEPHTQRTNRSADPGRSCLFFFQVGGGLFGQFDARGIDLSHFGAEAVAIEPKAVCTEGVGLKDFRARLEVLLVDGEDHARIGEIQLIEAPVDEDAAGIQHRAHSAISEDRPVGENVCKLRHSSVMLTHRWSKWAAG